MKSKGKGQQAEVVREDESRVDSHPLLLSSLPASSLLSLSRALSPSLHLIRRRRPRRTRNTLSLIILPLVLCALAPVASAQKRPKPALSTKEARRVVAATPGFALGTGAVKVKEVGPAGSSPVIVNAEVTGAIRLAWVEDESASQTGGVFKQKRWRAVEFRTGDRAWEEFDLISDALGPERTEAVRHALEALVTEFDARQAEAERGEVVEVVDDNGTGSDNKKGKGEKKGEVEKKAAEPLTRGALTVKQLSPMGSSAVAEVTVAAAFGLSKDARGKWRVTSVEVNGETVSDLETLWRSVNARKASRVREDLAELGRALEAFRGERGFYVVGKDTSVLLDHLNPRYSKRIIRLDPWHNPYRYNGTQSSYTLGSDGPDGKQGTADDVTLSR